MTSPSQRDRSKIINHQLRYNVRSRDVDRAFRFGQCQICGSGKSSVLASRAARHATPVEQARRDLSSLFSTLHTTSFHQLTPQPITRISTQEFLIRALHNLALSLAKLVQCFKEAIVTPQNDFAKPKHRPYRPSVREHILLILHNFMSKL